MPRYFFDVHQLPPGRDDIGEDLPSDEAAWHEATRFAGELFKDIDGKLKPGQDWALDVTDNERTPLFTIRVRTKQFK